MFAQTIDADIQTYVDNINNGRVEEVKKVLPDLATKYPNNPGVLYLQGRLSTNGTEAVKFYQSIVDNFPKSEWADDALYAMYQYYYSLGLYKTADLKFQQLKKDYPSSPFVTGKPQPVLPEKENVAVNLPPKELPSDTAKPTPQPQAAQPSESYTLQVGAYASLQNAEKQKNFLEDRGINVEVTNKVRGGRSLYLVWAGSFATASEAKDFGKELKKKYKINSIVVERY
jgi:cell division septation protein DedD